MTALAWGEANGEAVKSDVVHMKLVNGDTQFRIVSGVIARMDYWVHNKEGKPRPFECLRFDRMKEKFIPGAVDPVSEFGLTEKDPQNPGKMRPLRCKRAYKCMVINRKTGKLEAMDLKKSIFDGILSTMKDLDVKDPTSIDFVVNRKGEQWHEVSYEIAAIKTMKLQGSAEVAALHEADKEIIENMKPIDELFPRMPADEMRDEVAAWLSGGAAEKEEKKGELGDSAKEAISELE